MEAEGGGPSPTAARLHLDPVLGVQAAKGGARGRESVYGRAASGAGSLAIGLSAVRRMGCASPAAAGTMAAPFTGWVKQQGQL